MLGSWAGVLILGVAAAATGCTFENQAPQSAHSSAMQKLLNAQNMAQAGPHAPVVPLDPAVAKLVVYVGGTASPADRGNLASALAKAGFQVAGTDAAPHDLDLALRIEDEENSTGAGDLRMTNTTRRSFVDLVQGGRLVGSVSAQALIRTKVHSAALNSDMTHDWRPSVVTALMGSIQLQEVARSAHPGAGPPAAGTGAYAGFAPKAGAAQPAAFALVVGIEKYRDAPAATGARADAERFAQLAKTTLGVPEENLRVALDDRASKGDIEKHLTWLKLNVPAGGRVYLFFSGHGAPNPSAGTPFLFPYDGDAKYVDSTALPLDGVLASLEATKAKDAVAFVDSCFSGAGGRSVLPRGTRPLVKVKETAPQARVALFSAASGSEISGATREGDRGLFSKLVADGLGSGLADANGDGKVTLEELFEWVKPRVESEARRDNREQTPSLVAGRGASARLVVASGLGGK